MVELLVSLTTLSEAQRAQASERYAVIRPALEDGISQAQVARTHNLAVSTVKRYREKGLQDWQMLYAPTKANLVLSRPMPSP
jgi:DNA-binding NarL/FixJ family response regulator